MRFALYKLSIVALFAIPSTFAQTPQVQLHPKYSDVATMLNGLDIALNKIDLSLATLPTSDPPQVSEAFHERVVRIREIARRYAAIITVSNGREMPPASDLFLLYTESQNAESFVSNRTESNKLIGINPNQAKAATDAIHAQVDLLYLIQSLQYAVADRIDAQESQCTKRSH